MAPTDVTLGGCMWPAAMVRRWGDFPLLVTLPAAQNLSPQLVKSTGQLARGLQRWYLMSFSGFSKTLI